MRIIKRATLAQYAVDHAVSRAALTIWQERTQKAKWTHSDDVLSDFPSAKVLNAERVRFEIGSNHRLVAAIFYPAQAVYIKFIGTHAEYDKINALTVGLY
ncbi:type II toxin-antitoxin system HigB family toxin [Skermanella mucosa]|uniref:type II toxin-antitoxin system HigB family toxin n=1 Tax=Skermanella mucosa TaxID=1789672 RepID=UPI00192CBD1E|nr:type II toxin-antitoxin system HigB family toxin [Skermanella mucosa]UEM19439.1 type II toxin-antitoxin system HigB family toxin [Skermanella mucosa]